VSGPGSLTGLPYPWVTGGCNAAPQRGYSLSATTSWNPERASAATIAARDVV